jgi:hypothetical protein
MKVQVGLRQGGVGPAIPSRGLGREGHGEAGKFFFSMTLQTAAERVLSMSHAICRVSNNYSLGRNYRCMQNISSGMQPRPPKLLIEPKSNIERHSL